MRGVGVFRLEGDTGGGVVMEQYTFLPNAIPLDVTLWEDIYACEKSQLLTCLLCDYLGKKCKDLIYRAKALSVVSREISVQLIEDSCLFLVCCVCVWVLFMCISDIYSFTVSQVKLKD